MDGAEALWPQLIARDSHGREVVQSAALGIFDRVGDEVHLDVGRSELGTGFQESNERRGWQAVEAAPGCDIAQRLGHRADAACPVVVGHARIFHPPDDGSVEVVAEMLPDRRQRVANGDAMTLQYLRPPDARELQQLRRRNRTRRQDHLATYARFRVAPLV